MGIANTVWSLTSKLLTTTGGMAITELKARFFTVGDNLGDAYLNLMSPTGLLGNTTLTRLANASGTFASMLRFRGVAQTTIYEVGDPRTNTVHIMQFWSAPHPPTNLAGERFVLFQDTATNNLYCCTTPGPAGTASWKVIGTQS